MKKLKQNKRLLNSKINPIGIREQLDNIILDIYSIGQLSTDQIEEKLKEKYNLELVDDIDAGKIPFFDLIKLPDTAYMMVIGETSEPKRPKREYEEIKSKKY